ncbi:MAG: N-acetyltransferase [Proteobacteria bacterium]|nr:N-acetyltransferase [Pseudomonadota bacterium]
MSTPVTIRPATLADMPEIKALSARVFGPGRFVRTAYRIREGTPDVSAFCRVAEAEKRVVAAIRMTEILIGGRPGALLLGPLAVAPELANQGHGRRLIAESLAQAKAGGRELVLLVGDLPYYGRLGFVLVPRGQIEMPGPVDPDRLLALELAPGALAAFRGLVTAA